ncbi:MAG: hypothetical protein A3G09_03250 [Candidatus Moranbacteria bacterium RIFCSPLOWO2_12_FULL_48_12]|nr:MAG: hypothetical protein A3G09_03250 [Candidatus Moranbacteria bacterium RIFCSPLOWO2_12_FULL_48_12]
MKKYHIGKSKIHKKGIILDKSVKKDEVIFVFVGHEVTVTSRDWFHGLCWLQVGYAKWIVPCPGSAGEYLNHSCSPTAGVHGNNRIVAMRPMKKGEEVTIDYALSETYPLWHMRCHCKAKNCRKIVKPYQDLSHQRMKKYINYTSKYILDMKMHISWEDYIEAEKSVSRGRNFK